MIGANLENQLLSTCRGIHESSAEMALDYSLKKTVETEHNRQFSPFTSDLKFKYSQRKDRMPNSTLPSEEKELCLGFMPKMKISRQKSQPETTARPFKTYNPLAPLTASQKPMCSLGLSADGFFAQYHQYIQHSLLVRSKSNNESKECYTSSPQQQVTSTTEHSNVPLNNSVIAKKNVNDGNNVQNTELKQQQQRELHGKKELIKDAAYWERRRRNNNAAKRSRDVRRQKEDDIALKATFLEQENLRLRVELASLKAETERLRALILAA